MAFLNNGYPERFLDSIIKRCMRDDTPLTANPPSQDNNPVLVLPYYRGLGEKIQWLGRSLNFKVRFQSSVPFRSILRTDKIKIPFDRRPGVIYEIKCCCNAYYIGETGNNLLHRFREHLACLTRYKNAERSQAPWSTTIPRSTKDHGGGPQSYRGHGARHSLPQRPPSQIICHESNVHLRQIKESLLIGNNCTINRDRDVEVSEVWNAAINKTRCCTRPS
uniref:GIY-YIG domain-containing protein n=1 Tax=Trichuris muris TaxID=70415 RepID=A0A5S6R5Y2_TRIMR